MSPPPARPGAAAGPIPFFMPFPRNADFVGRADDLDRLHAVLQARHPVGIRPAGLTGMGSIGKTQVAVEYVYRHRDVGHLEELLRHTVGTAGRRLIVTDTVFSMDGDLAPLPDLAELAQRHDCLLVADEAHATGVLGQYGRGVAELLPPRPGFDPRRLVAVGTLSKALGSQGGFVRGPGVLIDYLVNHARPYVYSTALAPPAAAAARRAVALVAAELGMPPVAQVVWGAKLGTVAWEAVVFSNRDTASVFKLATAISGLPS